MSRRVWIIWSVLTALLLALELFAWLSNSTWRAFENWSHLHIYKVRFQEAPWYWRVDHHVHLLVAALATWWMWLTLTRWPAWRQYAPLMVALILCVDEFCQSFDAQRTLDRFDLLSGLAGILLASLVLNVHSWFSRPHTAR